MNQPGFTVNTNVGLHAKVPLITLLGLVHIRITLLLLVLVLVLGGTRRADNTGIDDGASAYLQTIFLQVFIDQIKQSILQIWSSIKWRNLQIDTHELSHGAGVVQNFLGSRIGEIEPVLQEVDAQHSLYDANRSAASPLWIWIEGFNGFAKLLPRNNRLHVIQKLLLADFLAKLLEAVGERCLFHTIINLI